MNLKDYCSFLKEAGVADPRRYLATELGLSKATINSYICGRRLISPENCLTLVNLSRGHLTCEELRPDIRYLEAIQTCTLLLSSLFDEAERGDSFTTRATPEVLSETVWFNDFQPT